MKTLETDNVIIEKPSLQVVWRGEELIARTETNGRIEESPAMQQYEDSLQGHVYFWKAASNYWIGVREKDSKGSNNASLRVLLDTLAITE